MGRKSVSTTSRSDKREIFEGPLKIKARGKHLHITGTIKVRDRRFRCRRSLGLLASEDENWELAREIARNTVIEYQNKVIHGIETSQTFDQAASSFIKSWEKFKPTDAMNIKELCLGYPLPKYRKRQIAEPLKDVPLSELTKRKMSGWYDRRFPNHSPATVRRHQNTFGAVIEFAGEEMDERIHKIKKRKLRKTTGKSLGKQLLPGELEKLIEFADDHAKPIIAAQFATGARTEMLIHLKIQEHFILVPGRGKVFFPDSKNGSAYEAALHDFAVDLLLNWLDSRDDKHKEMFLTARGEPFARRTGYGGHIRYPFNKARDALADWHEENGRIERAEIIRTITPKWGRHNFANWLRREGADFKDIMEAGMWKKPDVILEHYMGDAPARVSDLVRSLPFDTNLTHKNTIGRKN